MDDATSMLMELRFVTSESTFSYFDALESYFRKHGRPVAFYRDKHTVFQVSRPSQHMTRMTQFGRALAEQNKEILCVNSSQAKGRVERANRTFQDRLVKELRLAGIPNCKKATRSCRSSRSVTTPSSQRPPPRQTIYIAGQTSKRID
jgi:hypothetical protein